MPFLGTASGERATKVLRNMEKQEWLQDYHRRLWPGVEVQKLHSKHAKNHKVTNNQDSWLRERTLCTSNFVAMICFLINCKYRDAQSRGFACTGFRKLLSAVCSDLGGISLPFNRFTHDDESDDEMTGDDVAVDDDGMVAGSDIWTFDFWQTYVHDQWLLDCGNDKKPWILESNGMGRIPLASFLCFALDPQHPRHVTRAIFSRALNLMTELAFILDTSVLSFGRHSSEITGQRSKNTRVQSAARVFFLEKMANELWDHKVTC